MRKEQKKARFSIKIIISDYIVLTSTIYIHENLWGTQGSNSYPSQPEQ